MRKKRKFVKNNVYRLRRFMLLGGLALVVLLAVGIPLLLKSGGSLLRGKSDLPFSASSNYAFTGNGFLYTSEGSLNFHSLTRDRENSTAALQASDKNFT